MKLNRHGQDGNHLFLLTSPLEKTRRLAAVHNCDIGIPNGAGVGNILMYTRVVEDLARKLGRPLRILTGRFNPIVGVVTGEGPFPLWENHPFVDAIVDADLIDPKIMVEINSEMDNLCQFSHTIENIAYYYGVRPRHLRASIYLSKTEQSWALDKLRDLRRPLICIHPHGMSSPKPDHPWHVDNWRKLVARLNQHATVLEIFMVGVESKDLDSIKIETTLRQMMSLVWASDLFIGFDSSVAHIATAFELPSTVLWDPIRKLEIEERWQVGFAPAALSRWGYPQNQNLMILGDRDDTIVKLIIGRVDAILGSHA